MGQTQSKQLPRYFGHSVPGSVLWRWRQEAIAACHAHHIPPTEVDWLLQEVTEIDRLGLRLGRFQYQPTVAAALPFDELQARWQQRINTRLPIQYIVGQTEWRQFTMTVSPAVLIPRPETELLIDLALAATAKHLEHHSGHWADLGTGSGVLALGLAAAFPMAQVHGVDCSTEALAIAQHNANINGLGAIHWHQGTWFSPFEHQSIRFSGIVSNPPYIPSAMVLELQPEVANHEPHLALDGGKDGLNCIRDLIQTAPQYLVPNGVLLIEMMSGQSERVRSLLEQQGNYHHIKIHSDLAGIERFACAYHQ